MSITRNPSVPELTDFDFTEKDISDDTEKENKEKNEGYINENNKKTDFHSGMKSIFSNFLIQNSPNIAVKCNTEENVKNILSDSLNSTFSEDESLTNLMDKSTKNETQNSNLKNKTKLLDLEKNNSVGFLSKSLSSFSFLSSFTSNNQESNNNEVNKKFSNNNNDNNNNDNDNNDNDNNDNDNNDNNDNDNDNNNNNNDNNNDNNNSNGNDNSNSNKVSKHIHALHTHIHKYNYSITLTITHLHTHTLSHT